MNPTLADPKSRWCTARCATLSAVHRIPFRRQRLAGNTAAARISAYIYGNLIVLSALVPIELDEQHVGILIVLGASFSTFLAHSFAEAVSLSVRSRRQLTVQERVGELRDSVPVLSSAAIPCLILAAAWLGWIEPRAAQIIAEIVILGRIASTVFVIQRLLGRKPTGATVVASLGIGVVATIVVVIKIVLTH